MGSAPVQRSWETRMGSSANRGAYVRPGATSGTRAVRLPRSRAAEPLAVAAFTPADLSPVYWYDAADATTIDWPAHGFGADLSATSSPTLVPAAVNGQPGVRLDSGEKYSTAAETAHAFTNGMAALYVVEMGTNPGSFLQMDAGSLTSYFWSDASFGEIELGYSDETGSDVSYIFNAPAGSAAYICEWTVSAAGVPSLSIAGVPQTPTSTSGSAGGTTEAVGSLSIGPPAQSPTVLELIVYDADDSAGLSDARTFLATKYALTA